MSRRKSFEELAITRMNRRTAQIRKLVEAIAYDFFDSEIGAISGEANLLGEALDQFEEAAAELIADFRKQEAA